MKRFKKVLALVLAGVLALAMLTACTMDPDQQIPTDGSYEIVHAVNTAAVNAGEAEVTYSVKYSEITKKLLENWLTNKDGKASDYAAGYNAAVKDLGNAKVVIGLTSTTEYPKTASTATYLAYKTSQFNAGTIVADQNYTSATHIGVAYVTTNDGRTYRLVCLFSVPKQ